MKYETVCVSCGGVAVTNGDVTEEQLAMHARGGLAQNVFKDLDVFDREVIISHMCYNCIEKFYNRPAPGHEAAFGNSRGECDCCGAPLWDKDEKDGLVVCPSCKTVQGLLPYEQDGELNKQAILSDGDNPALLSPVFSQIESRVIMNLAGRHDSVND